VTRWTTDELETIGGAEEVQIAAARSDGKLRQPVTVWIVRHGDTLYVRSAVKGPNASWFQGVRETHQGRIWGGGIEKDVTLAEANQERRRNRCGLPRQIPDVLRADPQ
jgi:hypothetical protein